MVRSNGYDGYDEYPGNGVPVETTTKGWGSWADHMDWLGLREEVQSEVRAEIVLLGLGNAGKSTLFNSLRGWPVVLTALKLGRQDGSVEERMGLFTLVDLPKEGANGEDLVLQRLENATLLVYLLDGSVGQAQRRPDEAIVRPADCRWIGRLKAIGRPLLVVLNKADLWADQLDAVLASLKQRLGVEVIPISAYDSLDAQRHLLERMTKACPTLALPLGREVAVFRREAARRLIRRAALMCGLVAMQPIPLIDLPMQVGTQVGLVARISTMYGRPPSSDYSSELIVTGAGSMAFRLLALQIAKLVPVLGWVVSGVLGATTTWLLGRSTVAYFEGWMPPRRLQDVLGGRWRGSMSSRFRQRFRFIRHLHPLTTAIRMRAPRRKRKSRAGGEDGTDVFVWDADE
jgi:GTP-binding protein Era